VVVLGRIYIYMYNFGFIEMEKTAECALCFEQVEKDMFGACPVCHQASCPDCTKRWRDHQMKEELIPSCPFCRHKDSSSAVPAPRALRPLLLQRCLLLLLILLIVSLPLAELYFSKDSVLYAYLLIVGSLVLIFCYHSQILQCQPEEEGYDDYAV